MPLAMDNGFTHTLRFKHTSQSISTAFRPFASKQYAWPLNITTKQMENNPFHSSMTSSL